MRKKNTYSRKRLDQLCGLLIIFVGLSYLFIALFFLYIIYIGPLTTKIIQRKLHNHPIDIIVSFTTTPYRIDQIKPVIESVERQSIKPKKIYLNIPWKFKRENTEYIIPDWLKDYPNIIINRTKDYGPATKLIATLEKEHDPNTIIITIDDDTIYPKHMVRNLIKFYLDESNQTIHQSNTVFAAAGLHLLFAPNNHGLYFEYLATDNSPATLLVGSYGVAYKRSFFKDDIFLLLNDLPLSCFLSDDLMLSGYLLANNINIVVPRGIYNTFSPQRLTNRLPSFFTTDALSQGANGLSPGNNEANYCNCLKFLTTKKNMVKFQKVLLARNKLINNNDNDSSNSFTVAINALCYYLIEIFPLLKQIVLGIMN